jgi:hypothetical protein
MESSSIQITCASDHTCTQTAVTKCKGCSKFFCITHYDSHCRLFREELAEIIGEQHQFENTLRQQINNPALHPLIKQIDEWEKESIDKIQQRANELRQRLLQLTPAHTNQLSQRCEQLSEQLITGQIGDAFVETDIHRWKQILNDLKANLASPSTITINQYMNIPLVQDIYVVSKTTNELFLQPFDNKVRIEENGQLAIHDVSIDTTEIRGRNIYTTGCHKIRLCPERSANKWTFLGINSKLTPLQSQSNSCPSSYGWSTNHCSWSNGQPKSTLPNKCIEMKTGDIIILIIDCDKFLIMMINERSEVKHELTVNLDYCPLPWQLQVILQEPLSRIRILRK